MGSIGNGKERDPNRRNGAAVDTVSVSAEKERDFYIIVALALLHHSPGTSAPTVSSQRAHCARADAPCGAWVYSKHCSNAQHDSETQLAGQPSWRSAEESWGESRFRVHKGLVSAPARKVRRIASRAVMFDDVTDDVCRGCLLIALPSKTGPSIDDGESTWSCEVRCRGGRGTYCWQGP